MYLKVYLIIIKLRTYLEYLNIQYTILIILRFELNLKSECFWAALKFTFKHTSLYIHLINATLIQNIWQIESATYLNEKVGKLPEIKLIK